MNKRSTQPSRVLKIDSYCSVSSRKHHNFIFLETRDESITNLWQWTCFPNVSNLVSHRYCVLTDGTPTLPVTMGVVDQGQVILAFTLGSSKCAWLVCSKFVVTYATPHLNFLSFTSISEATLKFLYADDPQREVAFFSLYKKLMDNFIINLETQNCTPSPLSVPASLVRPTLPL